MSRSDIGHDKDYQNRNTFLIGVFFSLLTDVFYEINAMTLPMQLFETGFVISALIEKSEHLELTKVIALTLLSAAASFGNAIGIGFVAHSLVEDGALSYLSETVSELVPVSVTFCTMLMVWSNLQTLINNRQYNRPLDLDTINNDNIHALLNHPNTNLLENRS